MSSPGELIGSLEDNPESFSVGDLVFANARGYISWPGILVVKLRHHGMVNFLGTDDTRKIKNAKIWPYDENSKAQFITRKHLEDPGFRDAILIAEKLSSMGDDNKENGAYFYRVLTEEDLQEQHGQDEESQELTRQKEARQGEASQKETSQDEASQEEPGKEEAGEEEAGKEEAGKDEASKEEPSQEADSFEELGSEEPNHEMVVKYLKTLQSEEESLNRAVEQILIDLVNVLRQSLKINHKDYPSALLALEELNEMTFSELILVRNFEAVHSIHLLCCLDTAHANYNEAAQVKLQARQLINRFAAMFNMPGVFRPFLEHLQSLSSIYRRFAYPYQQNLGVEEQPLTIMHLTDQDPPTVALEEKFDQQIAILRSSLQFRRKDYPSAMLAFDELLSMTFTKAFLLPKYNAVYFIYYLSRSGSVYPWNNLAKASLVRNLANQLMVRFFAVFNLPGITSYDFMVHFCSLYTSDTESDSDTESNK